MWLPLTRIKSTNAGRRVRAIESLAHEPDSKAVVALIGALADQVPRVRLAAAKAIGSKRDERCVQSLLASLRDPHAGVREAVVDALKEIGHVSTIPFLPPLLGDVDPGVRAHAAHALCSLGWMPATDEELVSFFIAIGRYSKAAAVGQAAVGPLLALLTDESGAKRRAVTEALSEIADARVIEAMTHMMEDPDPSVRIAALTTLGRTGDPSYATVILQQLDHPDKNVRACALESLTKIGYADALPLLMNALQDSDWSVRAVAAAALGTSGDSRALEPLQKALKEADGDVRQAVAEAIGRLGNHTAIEPLILAQLDPESGVRRAAETALSQIDSDWGNSEPAQRTLPVLKRALKHEDYGVRQTAAGLLERIFNIRQCEPWLVADVDAETTRRRRAVDALASVLWDDDPLLRFAGVWGLHQIGDERAVKPLSAKLKDRDVCVRRAAEQAVAHFGVRERDRGAARTHAWGGVDTMSNGPVV